jgi:hypothetical protein
MNGPDGLEERTADNEAHYSDLEQTIDVDTQRAEEERDSLITEAAQRIITGAAMLVMLCTCFTFGGCATLERHPVLTAVGTAIIVGSIAAAAEHHHDQNATPINRQLPFTRPIGGG